MPTAPVISNHSKVRDLMSAEPFTDTYTRLTDQLRAARSYRHHVAELIARGNTTANLADELRHADHDVERLAREQRITRPER